QYEATFIETYLTDANHLAQRMCALFEDRDRGGFFYTSSSQEKLIARNKELHDASVPSGNAMAATVLIRLGKLLGNSAYLESAGRTLAFAQSTLQRMPTASGQMLIALDLWRGPIHELVLVGGSDDEKNRQLREHLQQTSLPNAVFAARPGKKPGPQEHPPQSPLLDPLFANRTAINNQPTLYICQNFTCQAPVVGVQ